MAPTRQEVDRQLREAEEAMRVARRESQRIAEALKESKRVRAEALPKLKKAQQQAR